ncbi:hypothetical protein M514_08619 [Trichuris suis]|uniref:Regulator of telomere elongation helicase 1 homolog n=1 Tax=Trichuris suis TaxID=68888 RepID=A0A085MVA7_9BILA|nr:hypothetical protein M514_08619 [Trichuris suis]
MSAADVDIPFESSLDSSSGKTLHNDREVLNIASVDGFKQSSLNRLFYFSISSRVRINLGESRFDSTACLLYFSSHDVCVEGINIRFPFEPYPCQLDLMNKVVSCLEQGANAVLESPTGTGKTVALLCSTIAWLKSRRASENHGDAGTPEQDALHGRTQILYASRTHAQLSQVIKELNKTSYKDIQVCFLGSRDQLCVHPEVSQERDSTIKNYLCRSKVLTRSCKYYLDHKKWSPSLVSTSDCLPDIEELVRLGRRHEFCPFFKTREKQEEADLILMPYNYLLDPTTRRLNKVPLRGNILIFDEAHNLEKICEEAASFSFKITDIAAALKEARGALKMLLDEQESLRQTMEDSDAPFGSGSSVPLGSPIGVNLNELSHLILLMEGLEERLNEEVLPKLFDSPDACTAAFPGSFLQDLLSRAQFHPNLCEGISLLTDQVSSYLTTKGESSVWMIRGLALQKFSRLLNVIYGNSLSTERCPKLASATDFKVYLCSEKPGMDATAKDKPNSFMVNYWCFSAGYSMLALLGHGVHSVIVTSGTLSPLNSFANEMRIPFAICMEGEHVVERTHFEVYVCSSGPDGTSLNCSYANRSNEKYLASLGNSVVNLCRIVPQGLLVFFPSYGQLDFCTEHWKACFSPVINGRTTKVYQDIGLTSGDVYNSGIMKRIEKLKNVFVEPRHKDKFADVLSAYKKLVEEGMQPVGAVFFCVMRGKVSEGFDFADCAARAVVIIGIPFPPAFDPRVRLKKDYLNSLARSKQSNVDGETWYVLEAVRAVNQAIGRVIRHKEDFGAVILADCRFSDWPLDRFPRWLRSSVTSTRHFGEIVGALSGFFKRHSQTVRLPTKREIEVGQASAESTAAFEILESVYGSQEGLRSNNVSEPSPSESVWSSLQNFYSAEIRRPVADTASASLWDALANYSFSQELTPTTIQKCSELIPEIVQYHSLPRKIIRLKPTPDIVPEGSPCQAQFPSSLRLQHSSARNQGSPPRSNENAAPSADQVVSSPRYSSECVFKCASACLRRRQNPVLTEKPL